jgi:Raf kinase inhibitor-like YbhB/YbcL family protein
MRIVHHSRHIRPILLIIGLVILCIALSVMIRQTFSKNVPAVETPIELPKAAPFELSSPAFKNLAVIPEEYACGAELKTVSLTIKNAPDNTKEFALIMRDTSTEEGDKAHWVVWGISGSTTSITTKELPQGAVQGVNDDKTNTYLTPCPIAGTGEHTYVFELFALSDDVQLDPTTTEDSLIAAMNGKVIAKAQLTGKVTAKPAAQ